MNPLTVRIKSTESNYTLNELYIRNSSSLPFLIYESVYYFIVNLGKSNKLGP